MSDFLSTPKKNRKGKSNGQESRLAKELQAKKTPGSGSKALKGDLQNQDFLYEAKTTAKTQYTLKQEDLAKVERHAHAVDKYPVMVIELNNESFEDVKTREWAVLPMYLLKQLLGLS